MRVQEHLARAQAFEKSASKLDAVHDGELYIVFLMRAATNRVNAALHALDVTEEGPVAAGARVGDLNHSYKPVLTGALPPEVPVLFASLKFIEDLRPEYVRGPSAVTAALADACSNAHAAIVQQTTLILERHNALS